MLSRRQLLILGLPLVFTGVVSAQETAKKKLVRIVLLGDSTVIEYPPGSVRQGWGRMLSLGLQDHVRVRNMSGYALSSKTAIYQGTLKAALKEKSDYVFIQFGHMDSVKGHEGATAPFTEYKANLRTMIDACNQAGTQPVLITPMHRHRFYRERLSEELKPYAYAMRAVGREKRVPVVDLYSASGELMERIGEVESSALFANEGEVDLFSEKGARIMAALVLEGLRKVGPKYAELVIPESETDDKSTSEDKEKSKGEDKEKSKGEDKEKQEKKAGAAATTR